MKIVVTGSNGQLGREIVKQLSNFDLTVIPLDKTSLDVTNFNKVKDTLNHINPQIVINCAAYTKVDLCEKNEYDAFKVNAIAPQNLAIVTNKINSKIVHISTDYIFDGTSKVPYREYHKPNPKTVYGKSKLIGEKMVSEFNPKHFIFRTAWLYGDGKNFVQTMLKLFKDKQNIKVVDDQIGSPTSTKELSKAILNLIQTQYYGIYHATCEGQCSWYQFAKKIFEIKGIDIEIEKINSSQLNRLAERPKYSVLDNFMLKLRKMNTFKTWEDSIEEYLNDVQGGY